MERLVTVRYPVPYVPFSLKMLNSLIEKLQLLLGESKVLILSSTNNYAKITADSLAKTFNTTPILMNELNINAYYGEEGRLVEKAMKKIREIARTQKAETVIVITEAATTAGLIEGFSQEDLGVFLNNCEEAVYSTANILDFEKKTLILLYPLFRQPISL